MKKRILLLFYLAIILICLNLISSKLILGPNIDNDVSVFVDADAPIITILNPSNLNYNNATPLLINYTIKEPNLDLVWYSLNDNLNITISGNFSLNLPEGNYFLKIYANDTFERINFKEVFFTINNSLPYCNDKICNQRESCNNCEIDCGTCIIPIDTPPINPDTSNSGSKSNTLIQNKTSTIKESIQEILTITKTFFKKPFDYQKLILSLIFLFTTILFIYILIKIYIRKTMDTTP